MFCPNCGSNQDDSAKFCAFCGTDMTKTNKAENPAGIEPQEQSQQPVVQADNSAAYYGNGTVMMKKPNTKQIIIAVFVIIALAVGAWFIFSKNNHKSPEAVLNAYVDAINNRDAELLYEISADPVLSRMENSSDIPTVSDYTEEIQEFLDIYGNDAKIGVKIKSVENYESGGYTRAGVKCDLTVMVNGESQVMEDRTFPCVKLGDNWYFYD